MEKKTTIILQKRKAPSGTDDAEFDAGAESSTDDEETLDKEEDEAMAEEGGEAAEGGGENKQELQELEAEGMCIK